MARETRLEGKTFDQRYRIDEFVGSGGMSEVYRAHDLQIGIPVALKILKPSLSADEQQRARFINEARRTAGLRHAHVVLIYGFGEDHGLNYIAMQFLDGEPLDVYLRHRGPLPLDEAVDIVRAVASALDAAHRKDLIHRDVKAANVMRSPHGDITLTDFGLVREQATTRFTRTGTVMGTPQYMSPEQIRTPLDIDHRTDVYALGHLAYELLTGAPAIDENLSEYDIYEKQIKHTFTAPSTMVTGLGAAIDEVVAGALAKDRDDRYNGAGEFAAALAQAADSLEDDDEDDQDRDGEVGTNRMLLGLLAMAVMLLIAWFMYYSVEQARSTAVDASATAETIRAERETDEAVAAATKTVEAAREVAVTSTAIAVDDRATVEAATRSAAADDAKATKDAESAKAGATATEARRRDLQADAARRAEEAKQNAQATAAEQARRDAAAKEPVVRFYAKDNRTTMGRGDNCTSVIWNTDSGNPAEMQLARLARPFKNVPLSGSEEACFYDANESKMEFRLRYRKPNGEQVTLAVDIVRGN